MSLKHALVLANKGFHVFPLLPNSKLPAIEGFPSKATRDEKTIKDWWVDPVLDVEQPYNVGIYTGRFEDDQSLVVIDVDNKKGKNGSKVLIDLKDIGCDIPAANFTQVTPTGGLHIVLKNKEPVKQGVDVLGQGLDIRSLGGYIVGGGSTINGDAYTYNDLSVKDCPEWVLNQCGRVIKKSEVKIDVSKINQERAQKRAIDYLDNEAPTSIEGEGGDAVAYKVTANVKDFGVDKDTALELLMDHWNYKCEPPWDVDELSHKVDHAYKYGKNTPGEKAPESEFEPIAGVTSENFIEKINKEYALIFLEGNHVIMHETKDHKGRYKRMYLSEQSFKRKFSPYDIQQGRGRPKTYAELWLDSTNRREYKGVCFSPERKAPPGYFNIWSGFSAKATPVSAASEEAVAGFNMFQEHALHNVCAGDTKLFTWLMGYFAHLIQRPWERPLTTLVFRGRKGVGKNALIDRFGRLLKNHFMTAHDARYLTSNFNGHLDNCLLLCLDEAFWSGDKSAEGKLKGLTTAPEIMIERKGREPYMVDNLVRLLVVGNEDWLVPASMDERRYCVFDVAENNMQDGDFFRDMRIKMDEKGGCGVLLDYLQNFDLSQIDVNKAPSTAGLTEQKINSLNPIEQFWFDCLSEGQIIHADLSGDTWEESIEKSRLRDSFIRYSTERKIRTRIPTSRKFGLFMKKFLPSFDSKHRSRVGGKIVGVYKLGNLEQCRQRWVAEIGGDVNWDCL